jgi:preprotein translocase subunit SecF
MAIGNIYEMKNYKFLVLIPIALLLISLYFIPKIQLDQSLKGGVNIQLQTSNTSINIRSITAVIDSKIPGAEASISRSPGGISITIDSNSSIADAEQYTISMYNLYSNYTTSAFLLASAQAQLKSQPDNSTLAAVVSGETANETKYTSQMNTTLARELSVLSPFINSAPSYNSTNPASMLALAQGAYTNASAKYKSLVVSKMQSIISFSSYSYNDVTPTLGAFFLSQMETIIIAAFILVAIAVFLVFRSPIPAMAVVFSAANDIIVALGAMGAFGIPLGIASIGGILMLIGYSIDTSLLSSIRILKRSEDTPTQRAFYTFKTGATMTSSAIISFSILLIISYIAFIPTYYEIAGVVLAGLIADIFTTWFGNTPMVLEYKKKKEAGR